MFFFVATRAAHGLQPYNFAMSASEAAMFVAEAQADGIEVEVLDERGDKVSLEQLKVFSAAEAQAEESALDE